METKGRRLLVEFTCGRCGKVDFVPYMGNPACNETINMNHVEVPEGWSDASGYMPLLCDKCTTAYRAFMSIHEHCAAPGLPWRDSV